jgi:hypothetical protein
VGQCPRGQQGATRGRLHRSIVGSTTTALPPACSLTQWTTLRISVGVMERPARHRIGGARSQQIPRGKTTSISSERRRLTKRLGGGERGHSSEHFAQGGVNEGRQSWPESSSDNGGDPVARGATGVRERRRPGLGWVGLTDPDPSQLV